MELSNLGFGGTRRSPQGALLLHPSAVDGAGRRTVAGGTGAHQAHGLRGGFGWTLVLSPHVKGFWWLTQGQGTFTAG